MKSDTTLMAMLVASTLVSTLINLWFQHWNSRSIETRRVRLAQLGHLQEKQGDLIADLFGKLWLANYSLQRASAHEPVSGDLRRQYRSEAAKLFNEAARCFYPRQILFPEATALRIDALMRGLEDAQLRLSIVLEEPAAGREPRWDELADNVHAMLPRIFDELKELSRNLLRGET
jgi:hypothetical protein